MILDQIQKENDIHKIPLKQFPALAEEIRDFLVESVSKTGGHLASNLGVVELTLALHNVLHFPEDKLIWDVGHQAYTHKILTGRKDLFPTLRKEGGLSGFPKRSESACDAFDTGHSSNSLSAGLGYVRARDLMGQSFRVVSVIGDGALTGGLAFEALNNAAGLKTNFIIILNDNNMSISRNVGGMSMYLSAIRTAQTYTGMKLALTRCLEKIPKAGRAMIDTVRRTKSSIKQFFIPGMLFENMGLTYLGPVDGHNMRQMMKLFNEAKKVEGPVIVHVLTEKGHGYEPARLHPERFHGTGPFDVETGNPLECSGKRNYTDYFQQTLLELGDEREDVVAITAAMPEGTGCSAFAKKYPARFFDVGIAEGHAVSFSAGLALGGLLPIVAVYSSFLQRGFDQIIHDVCMQELHVIFAIDRAGLVGADGETHQGNFDLSYLRIIPNLTVMAPGSGPELGAMVKAAVNFDGPVAIRYSKEEAWEGNELVPPVEYGRSCILRRGKKTAFLAVGSMVRICREVMEDREEDNVTLVNVRFIKPLDTRLIDDLCEDTDVFVAVEENAAYGGFGQEVCAYLSAFHPEKRFLGAAIPDVFVPQGSIGSLRSMIGLGRREIERLMDEACRMAGENGVNT